MTGVKIRRWESELWSYVSRGDGVNCPLSSDCQIRQRGGWCPDDNKERLSQLLDEREFDIDRCDFIGSEGRRIGRVFQVVEMLAQKYLKIQGIRSPPVPTALISLVKRQHDIEVRSLPLKAYHGAIWCLREEWVIQIKGEDPSVMKRFTLFHEAFHILAHCHCRTTPVFRKRGTLQGCFNEMLADYFAICILMPRQWVKEKWAEINDLERMAEIFVVPKPAMWLRLRLLSLI